MTIKKAAILGGGVIGGGWLAHLIESGVKEVTSKLPAIRASLTVA